MLRLIAFIWCLVWLCSFRSFADDEGCFYEVEKACPDKNPCSDMKCSFIRNEISEVDTNGDGEVDTQVNDPVYECTGQIGYYNSPGGWYETLTASEGTRDDLYTSRVEETVYCWQKAGCPVQGCSEVTDVDDPSNTIWYCAEPSQTPQDDEDFEKKQYRVDLNKEACDGPSIGQPDPSVVEEMLPFE